MPCSMYHWPFRSYKPAKVDSLPRTAKMTTATTHRQLGIHAGLGCGGGIRSSGGGTSAGDTDELDSIIEAMDGFSEGFKTFVSTRKIGDEFSAVESGLTDEAGG